MISMTYKNDFGFNADTDELTTPAPWEDQPISIPLHVLRGLDIKLCDLEHECADVRRMWAENNARIRQLENENAKLKGDLDAMLAVDEWARVEE